jgi:hypothetical protein
MDSTSTAMVYFMLQSILPYKIVSMKEEHLDLLKPKPM